MSFLQGLFGHLQVQRPGVRAMENVVGAFERVNEILVVGIRLGIDVEALNSLQAREEVMVVGAPRAKEGLELLKRVSARDHTVQPVFVLKEADRGHERALQALADVREEFHSRRVVEMPDRRERKNRAAVDHRPWREDFDLESAERGEVDGDQFGFGNSNQFEAIAGLSSGVFDGLDRFFEVTRMLELNDLNFVRVSQFFPLVCFNFRVRKETFEIVTHVASQALSVALPVVEVQRERVEIRDCSRRERFIRLDDMFEIIVESQSSR